MILLHTNEKIRESEDEQEDHRFPSARLKKSPHLKETDMVSKFFMFYNVYLKDVNIATDILFFVTKRIQTTPY